MTPPLGCSTMGLLPITSAGRVGPKKRISYEFSYIGKPYDRQA